MLSLTPARSSDRFRDSDAKDDDCGSVEAESKDTDGRGALGGGASGGGDSLTLCDADLEVVLAAAAAAVVSLEGSHPLADATPSRTDDVDGDGTGDGTGDGGGDGVLPPAALADVARALASAVLRLAGVPGLPLPLHRAVLRVLAALLPRVAPAPGDGPVVARLLALAGELEARGTAPVVVAVGNTYELGVAPVGAGPGLAALLPPLAHLGHGETAGQGGGGGVPRGVVVASSAIGPVAVYVVAVAVAGVRDVCAMRPPVRDFTLACLLCVRQCPRCPSSLLMPPSTGEGGGLASSLLPIPCPLCVVWGCDLSCARCVAWCVGAAIHRARTRSPAWPCSGPWSAPRPCRCVCPCPPAAWRPRRWTWMWWCPPAVPGSYCCCRWWRVERRRRRATALIPWRSGGT
jgi:hypothetical protein